MDKVAFYDHNLTGDEINNIYTNGITATKGNTIEYTYDIGGNIRIKTNTIYNPETVEATTNVIDYAYDDANWKDKLAYYDRKDITYDEIGNPLANDSYTYTWQSGRELGGISGNGLSTSYKYNNGGIRTQKTE